MTSVPPRRSAYAWFVVLLLTAAHVLSYVDRQILNLMVDPIRADLGVSDTGMSLLMGFSFAIFYTVCGIPLAWWADRGSRRGLIALGAFAWSLATAACGLALRYGSLLAARIGVGIGEASLSPAAYSLITDYFPRERRASAISLFGSGVYIGSGAAYLLGGAIIHYASTHPLPTLPLVGAPKPWQFVFLLLGVVGAVFSVVLLAIREPVRGARRSTTPFALLRSELRANARTLICHHLGFAMIAVATYGSAAWIPSYLIRLHHWTRVEVGIWYGGAVALFGTLGVLAGGALADRLLRRGVEDATLRVGLFAALAAIPSTALFLLAGDRALVLTMVPAIFFFSMPFGVAPAGLQEVVAPAVRAQVSAIYLFVLNLLGLGFGPTAVALVTDYVYGDKLAVGHSLLLVCTLAPTLAAILLRLGRTPFRASLARQRALAA
ncbi:spinster family MFS transporter [Solimonas soli]|uniref:spinster family MFS transporter n=1 Tax=Solimonas soli TaxID=413479 RepID=UPI000488924B|nr:MFS transporter [Solimonas soli]